MTVEWRLTEEDVVKAIKLWLDTEHGINAEGAEISVYAYDGRGTAHVKGVIETHSTGPYR